jgi:hypothetical protein
VIQKNVKNDESVITRLKSEPHRKRHPPAKN